MTKMIYSILKEIAIKENLKNFEAFLCKKEDENLFFEAGVESYTVVDFVQRFELKYRYVLLIGETDSIQNNMDLIERQTAKIPIQNGQNTNFSIRFVYVNNSNDSNEVYEVIDEMSYEMLLNFFNTEAFKIPAYFRQGLNLS